MRKTLLMAMMIGFALAGRAGADTLDVPAAPADAPAAPAKLPARGISMKRVTKEFGAPKEKHAPVGGGTPKHPPITRWDYDGFTVVFEKSHVVDVVVSGHPTPVSKTDELKPAQPAP
jgi:hypothetical protein